MTERRHLVHLGSVGMGAVLVGSLLACQPYLSDEHPDVRTQPVAWQCPTATPVPTIIVGYEEEHGDEPPPTPTTVTERPIYSTPVPTATPYIRTGSDYYQRQRIRVGPLLLAVTGYRTHPAADATMLVHLIEVEVENTTGQSIEAHLQALSLLRAIRRADGRAVEGTWFPSAEAARAADVPVLDGVWQPGTTRATLPILAPVGRAEAWGMPFIRQDERRTGQTGGGYIWVRLLDDPHCGGARGGPPSDAYDPPGPAPHPVAGRAGWPVPPDTTISRGYGCHPFYTGVRGACPAGMWWHDGVDFASSPGTSLFAVRPMEIVYAGADHGTMDCSWIEGSQPPYTGFGLYVKAADQEGYTYWYGHASRLHVSSGQTVVEGQRIAAMGSTGCSTGSHLHFRVRLGGLDRNPFDVLEQP